MSVEQVKELLAKIKMNYQDFSITENKVKEWYKELEHYLYEDVLNKLEEHLRSEHNSPYIPKVYMLTKNLIKIQNKDKTKGIMLRCPNCGWKYAYNDFDRHLKRCNSIIYINEVAKKYHNKEINKDTYFKLNDKDFENKYNRILMYVYQNTKNKKEKERLENYFIGNKEVKGELEL